MHFITGLSITQILGLPNGNKHINNKIQIGKLLKITKNIIYHTLTYIIVAQAQDHKNYKKLDEHMHMKREHNR
jgi:hypothetical protein